MMHLPQIDADLVIRMPLPHSGITEEDLGKIRADFHDEGLNVSLRAEEVYPICTSWAEIAQMGATFLGGAAASHYAEKLFDALDRFLKVGIDRINLCLTRKGKTVGRDVRRHSREKAIALITEALEELKASEDEH